MICNEQEFETCLEWDFSAVIYAKSMNAELADFKRKYTDGYSLSPTSLLDIPKEIKLVLPRVCFNNWK
ncbi:hypothetical protein HDF26_001398 [Pedobacter cryoconitis]|uniref:hypothetical protein n=1 Tax=Pedobacter cryoconitis TaxID=188932 RepID=UPI001616B3E3|nr:hypothetical protein [Pedobacter cryoconitis]MBB6270971.1 hypothetical protein [Pedobacter cryoconitis]